MKLLGLGRFIVLLGLVLAVAGCGVAPAEQSMDTASGVEAAADDGGVRWAPGFELLDLSGASVTLEDTQGQVRLLDFWATWCAPCREEIPMLKELHAEYGDQGLAIISIADETADELQPFVDEHDIDYVNLVGNEQVNLAYGVLGLPTAYLVDREGRIVEFFVGAKPRRILEEKIRELLELPPST